MNLTYHEVFFLTIILLEAESEKKDWRWTANKIKEETSIREKYIALLTAAIDLSEKNGLGIAFSADAENKEMDVEFMGTEYPDVSIEHSPGSSFTNGLSFNVCEMSVEELEDYYLNCDK